MADNSECTSSRGRLGRASSVKRQTYYALNDLPCAGSVARALGVLLLLLIVANALLVGVGDAEYSAVAATFSFVFNLVSTAVFGVEYALRIWTADLVYSGLPPARARVRYMLSLMGIIDLMSFLPMAFIMAVPHSIALADAVRVIRLVRLIKVTRYMRGLKTVGIVFRKCQREIVAAFMLLALLCIASSVLMYEAEHAAQPDQFDSVLTGLYWSMTTMTSTGYGDLVPITPMGRLIGFVTMALSIGVVAIPAGIFSAGFVAEFRNAAPEGVEAPLTQDADDASAAAGRGSDDFVEEDHARQDGPCGEEDVK